jgi:hypothetical protein
MPENAFSYFKFIIVLQLFFAFSVTLVTYAMPDDTLEYVTIIQPSHEIDLETVAKDIQSSSERQMNIPVVDLGALVFHSGNIIVDLILNTVFAIPEMVTILINGFLFFFGVEAFVATYVKLLLWAVISAIYLIAILAFIMNIRSGVEIV